MHHQHGAVEPQLVGAAWPRARQEGTLQAQDVRHGVGHPAAQDGEARPPREYHQIERTRPVLADGPADQVRREGAAVAAPRFQAFRGGIHILTQAPFPRNRGLSSSHT